MTLGKTKSKNVSGRACAERNFVDSNSCISKYTHPDLHTRIYEAIVYP